MTGVAAQMTVAPARRCKIKVDPVEIFNIGDQARFVITMRDAESGLLVEDPDTLTLAVKSPSATTATLYTLAGAAITKRSKGTFECLVDVTEAGTWNYKWTAGTPAPAAEQGSFVVEADAV